MALTAPLEQWYVCSGATVFWALMMCGMSAMVCSGQSPLTRYSHSGVKAAAWSHSICNIVVWICRHTMRMRSLWCTNQASRPSGFGSWQKASWWRDWLTMPKATLQSMCVAYSGVSSLRLWSTDKFECAGTLLIFSNTPLGNMMVLICSCHQAAHLSDAPLQLMQRTQLHCSGTSCVLP